MVVLGDLMSKSVKKARSMINERTEEMKTGIKKACRDLKTEAEGSVDNSRKSIQKRPLASVAVAAGAAAAVGVVAGALLTRRAKKDTRAQHKKQQ